MKTLANATLKDIDGEPIPYKEKQDSDSRDLMVRDVCLAHVLNAEIKGADSLTLLDLGRKLRDENVSYEIEDAEFKLLRKHVGDPKKVFFGPAALVYGQMHELFENAVEQSKKTKTTT